MFPFQLSPNSFILFSSHVILGHVYITRQVKTAEKLMSIILHSTLTHIQCLVKTCTTLRMTKTRELLLLLAHNINRVPHAAHAADTCIQPNAFVRVHVNNTESIVHHVDHVQWDVVKIQILVLQALQFLMKVGSHSDVVVDRMMTFILLNVVQTTALMKTFFSRSS